MNIRPVLLVLLAAIAATSCATKRYPLATPMSHGEANMMTCKDLQVELLRADAIEKTINETGDFDTKTVIGFLGDFGIGNGMAKDEAREAVANRRMSIHEAQLTQGCTNSSSMQKSQPDSKVNSEVANDPSGN